MTEAQMVSVIMSTMAVVGFISLVSYVLMAIAQWKIFTKAYEAGWKGIIPLLNNYTMFKISWDTKMFWIMLVLLIVFAVLNSIGNIFTTVLGFIVWVGALVINVIQSVKLSRAFGHGGGFAVGLLFFPLIFMLILGFGNSQYIGK